MKIPVCSVSMQCSGVSEELSKLVLYLSLNLALLWKI
jgi:hypothetical protein